MRFRDSTQLEGNPAREFAIWLHLEKRAIRAYVERNSQAHVSELITWTEEFFAVAHSGLELTGNYRGAIPARADATGAPGLRSGGQRRSARSIWFEPGVWVIAAFNVAVLGVFLVVLWQRLGDAERIAQLGYILLGTFYALEIVAAVSLRIRHLWTRRAG